jgi:hypothetical protein
MTDIMEMDSSERQAYVELLVEQIERENSRIEESRRR